MYNIQRNPAESGPFKLFRETLEGVKSSGLVPLLMSIMYVCVFMSYYYIVRNIIWTSRVVRLCQLLLRGGHCFGSMWARIEMGRFDLIVVYFDNDLGKFVSEIYLGSVWRMFTFGVIF